MKEAFPKPNSGGEQQEAVLPADIEPVLAGLKERVADVGPVLDEYSLPPEKAGELNETLKDMGAL